MTILKIVFKHRYGGINLKLEDVATQRRIDTLKLIKKAGMGHIGGDFSCADILVSLYYSVMNINSNEPNDPDRDRYIQSKGHSVEILWTILADKGFIDQQTLSTFGQYNSKIIGHPNNEIDGVEMNTGSLGHGLAISVGIALGAKLDDKQYHTYTLLGDGELAEGSVWEAAISASHFKLDNLTAIIDYNKLQISGETKNVMSHDPLREKWESFGWNVIDVWDGNDISSLLEAFNSESVSGKPKCIIAHTVKGKGISAAENVAGWHHKVPNDEEFETALRELEAQLNE